MGLPVHSAESFHAHMRVELSGGEGRVSEEFLHHAKVGPTFQQVRRGTVTQGVWAHRLPGPLGGPMHHCPRHPLIEPAALDS